MEMSRDEDMCQAIAESYWRAATSDNQLVARYDSPVYRSLDRAFVASVRAVYGLSLVKARRVRDMLSELGPHDGAAGTGPLWGVKSYVAYVKARRGEF